MAEGHNLVDYLGKYLFELCDNRQIVRLNESDVPDLKEGWGEMKSIHIGEEVPNRNEKILELMFGLDPALGKQKTFS